MFDDQAGLLFFPMLTCRMEAGNLSEKKMKKKSCGLARNFTLPFGPVVIRFSDLLTRRKAAPWKAGGKNGTAFSNHTLA